MPEEFKVVDDLSIDPNHDFVVVQVDQDDDLEKTAGGILIPMGAVTNKKTQTGVVVAVGPGRVDFNGKLIPMKCKEGDRIIFAIAIGYPMVLGKKGEHVIIKDYDAMGILHEESHMEEAGETSGIIHITDSENQVL